MKIGIGGKVGPIRGGVSNRGVGLGVGPVSVGGGWRRGRGTRGSGADVGKGIGLLLVLLLLFLALSWPYLLARQIALDLGAERNSTGQAVAGWMAESVYLLGIGVLFISSKLSARSTNSDKGPRRGSPSEIARAVKSPEAAIEHAHVSGMEAATPLRVPDKDDDRSEKELSHHTQPSISSPEAVADLVPRRTSARSVQPRGLLAWMQASLWTFPAIAFVGFGTWASFLYLAARDRSRTWLLWAGAWAGWAVTIGVALSATDSGPKPSGIGAVYVGAAQVMWLVGMAHVFTINHLRLRTSRAARQPSGGVQFEPIDPEDVGLVGRSGSPWWAGAVAPPPAGWYRDPERPSCVRYWDGAGWTEYRENIPPTAPTGWPAPAG